LTATTHAPRSAPRICHERSDIGAVLIRDDQHVDVADDEEFRACGFSPQGSVFVLATSPNLIVLKRDLPPSPTP
jgi:hypothetical protein